MSLEAQPANKQPEETVTPAENANVEQAIVHSGKLPEGQGREVPHIEYPEDLSEVADRLEPVNSPADLEREPKLLPITKEGEQTDTKVDTKPVDGEVKTDDKPADSEEKQGWLQKKATKVTAATAGLALALTGVFLAGRSSQGQEEQTPPRPTASAPATPGVVPSPIESSGIPTETATDPNRPLTPEDVAQTAEALKLPAGLYDDALMQSLVTPDDSPKLEKLIASYPSYHETLTAQITAFEEAATAENIQAIQNSYYELLEKGTTYDPAKLVQGDVEKMSTEEYVALMSRNGVKEFPESFPTPEEIKGFNPTDEAKSVDTYIALSARQDSMNDRFTMWVAQNEKDINDYNARQSPDKTIAMPSLSLDNVIRAGFANPSSAFGSEVIPSRKLAFVNNPYDAVAKFDNQGGYVLNNLSHETKLGTNTIDVHGFSAVYNVDKNGVKVPVVGTYMLVPLKESIVEGKLVNKEIVVPTVVWQTELNPLG